MIFESCFIEEKNKKWQERLKKIGAPTQAPKTLVGVNGGPSGGSNVHSPGVRTPISGRFLAVTAAQEVTMSLIPSVCQMRSREVKLSQILPGEIR